PPRVKTHGGVNFRSSREEWYSEHDDELLDVWHVIEDSIKTKGVVMMEKCRFNHFCAFVISMTTTENSRSI
ncbi:unnamed protein product, partial [Ectocarpus sp. 6 AP-2014]